MIAIADMQKKIKKLPDHLVPEAMRFIDFLMHEDERMRGRVSPRGSCPLTAIDGIVSDGSISSEEIDGAVYGL